MRRIALTGADNATWLHVVAPDAVVAGRRALADALAATRPIHEHKTGHDERDHGRRRGGPAGDKRDTKAADKLLATMSTETLRRDDQLADAALRVAMELGADSIDLTEAAERAYLGGGIAGAQLYIDGDLTFVVKDKMAGGHWQGAEVMASRISDELGLDVVPHTAFAALPDGGVGIAQEFRAGKTAAEKGWSRSPERRIAEGMGKLPAAEQAEALHQTGLMQAAVLDTIIANVDRHGNNFLLRPVRAAAGGQRIVAIDNGLPLEASHEAHGLGSYQKTLTFGARALVLRTAGTKDTAAAARETLSRVVREMPDLDRDEWRRLVDVPDDFSGDLQARSNEASYWRYRALKDNADRPDRIALIMKEIDSLDARRPPAGGTGVGTAFDDGQRRMTWEAWARSWRPERLQEHDGPGPHKSGSPQSAHGAGGGDYGPGVTVDGVSSRLLNEWADEWLVRSIKDNPRTVASMRLLEGVARGAERIESYKARREEWERLQAEQPSIADTVREPKKPDIKVLATERDGELRAAALVKEDHDGDYYVSLLTASPTPAGSDGAGAEMMVAIYRRALKLDRKVTLSPLDGAVPFYQGMGLSFGFDDYPGEMVITQDRMREFLEAWDARRR